MNCRIFPILLAFIIIYGCGKKSTESEKHELVGTWNAFAQTTYWGSISNPDSTEEGTFSLGLVTMTWEFEADNDFRYIFENWDNPIFVFQDLNGTWSTDGDQLTINYMEVVRSLTYEVEDDKLTTTEEVDPAEGEGDWIVIVFSRE